MSIHYSPEVQNLKVVGEIEWNEPCYSFDTTIVWRHADGSFYIASDSGCSCPQPFEDYQTLEDLDGPYTANQAIEYLVKEYNDRTYKNDSYADPQYAELIERLRRR